MPELISNQDFWSDLSTLDRGDIGHHSMLYPGIYPSDRELHDLMRSGGTFDTDIPFFDATRSAIKNGATIEWFGTLPKPGEFGCDEQDILAKRRMFGYIAAVGIQVKVVTFSDHAQDVYDFCGEHSAVVEDFKAGLERDDPRSSSWALFRKRQFGGLAISHLHTMDYQDGVFAGRQVHYPPGPVAPNMGKWTYKWREICTERGKLIAPLSS
jgi:hypothetical protein